MPTLLRSIHGTLMSLPDETLVPARPWKSDVDRDRNARRIPFCNAESHFYSFVIPQRSSGICCYPERAKSMLQASVHLSFWNEALSCFQCKQHFFPTRPRLTSWIHTKA